MYSCEAIFFHWIFDGDILEAHLQLCCNDHGTVVQLTHPKHCQKGHWKSLQLIFLLGCDCSCSLKKCDCSCSLIKWSSFTWSIAIINSVDYYLEDFDKHQWPACSFPPCHQPGDMKIVWNLHFFNFSFSVDIATSLPVMIFSYDVSNGLHLVLHQCYERGNN